MLDQSRPLAILKLSFKESGLFNQSDGTTAGEYGKDEPLGELMEEKRIK